MTPWQRRRMRSAHRRPPGLWLTAPLVLILCLRAAPALAGVADTTIRRIVDLNVQAAENNYLAQSQQIDYETTARRRRTINAELKPLYQQIGQLPRDAQRQVKSEIDGLTKARLATLVPQWKASG